MASRPRDPEVRIQALEALLVDDPTSPAFFPLAGLIWEKGEADKAVDMLSSGLQHHPVYSAPRVLLGEIYLAKEQVTEAIDELEKAVARTPWNLAAQRLLLNCFQKSGDDAGARKARVAIGMFDPADEEAFASLDVALAPPEASSPGAGSPVQDEAPLEESPDAVPTPSLAELYISQGHIDKALEVYTSLAGEEPENIEYMEKITELQAQLAEEGDDGSAAAELEDFDSILNEAEGAVDAADAGGPEVDDFDSIFEEEESGGAAAAVDEATDTGAPELEDFDSILEEAGVAADAGAAELEDFDSLLDEVGEDTEAVAEAPEEESGGLEDFDSLLEEAEGAADAGAAELEDFDSLLDEVGEDAEAVAEAPEEDSGGLEDFDSLLEEAEGAADAGAADVEDFDSLLDEVGEDTEAVAEAPEEESGGLEDFDSLLDEAEGAADAGAAELEDFDSLLDEAGEDTEAVAEAPVEPEAQAAEETDEPAGEVDDLEALFAGEPVEASRATAAPVDENIGDDLDALLADEFDPPKAPATPVEEEAPKDEEEESLVTDEEVSEAEEEIPVAEAEDVSVSEDESPVAEVEEEEAGGALDEFESLLADEPEAAVEVEMPVAEVEEEVAVAAPDDEDFDSLLAEEPEVVPASASVEEVALDAMLAEEFDEPEAAVDEEMLVAGAAEEIAAPEDEIPVAEVEEEAGGALDEFESLLADEPEAVEEEMLVAEVEDVSAPEEETPVAEVEEEVGGALDEFESLLADEPVAAVDEEMPITEAEEVSVLDEQTQVLEVEEPEVAVDEPIPVAEAEEEAPEQERHMMQGIIEVYLGEEKYEMALDICRKAILVGTSSDWLVIQIQEIEAIISERMKRVLPQSADEDIEDVALEPPTDSDVVKSLLGWLDTIQRHRAKLSADSQKGSSRDIV